MTLSPPVAQDKYARLLGQFRDNCGVTVALRPLVLGFAPELVAAFATRIVSMAKEAEPLGCSKCDVFVTLGDKLLEYPPPQEQKLSVLNEVWKVVRVEPDLGSYARCVVSFIRLMLRHYTEREVLILLKDLAKHITANRDTIDSVLPQLESVVDAIVNYSRGTFGTILSSEYFMTVLDAFKVRRGRERERALAVAGAPAPPLACASPPRPARRATGRRSCASNCWPPSLTARAPRATRC